MADKSKIVLTFTDEPINGQYVEFRRRDPNDILNFEVVRMTFKSKRKNSYEIPVVTDPFSGAGWASANDYGYYFDIDYNGYGLYIITRFEGTITIEFAQGLDIDWEIYSFVETTGVIEDVVITNVEPPTFELVTANETAVVDQECTFIMLEITATEPIKSLRVNGQLSTVDSPNVYKEIGLARGLAYEVYMINVDDLEVLVGTFENDTLTSEKINVYISQSIAGATVSVVVDDTNTLTLQYKIDSGDYGSESVFTGQDEGDYTMLVKDQWGCEKSKDYTINEFGTRAPYLVISDANSVSFKEQVDVDNLTVFRNDINTLAHQEFPNVKYCEVIKFINGDITTIQIKSNFTTIIPTLRKENLDEVELTLTQMSQNLNRYVRMDAIYYEYKTGQTGIYFEDGSIYDEFGSPLEDYALYGNLPDFAVIGNYVTILGGLGTYQIKDVIYDLIKKKKAIILELNYPGVGEESIIVESIYDLLPFEIYEFDIVWGDYGSGLYDLMIENTDEENGTVIHLSENILIADEHEDTVAIKYFNTNNRDIFYKYGIEHFIRIPLLHKRAVPKDETEINITDDGTDVVQSDVKEINEFQFDLVSETTMRKIVLALSSEFVYIQDEGYAKFEPVNFENDDNTNGYFVTAKMIKKGVNYSTTRDGISEDIFSDDVFDVPAFITDGTGFIKS